MIKVIDRSENQIYDTNKHLIDKFTEFSSENLGFDQPVSVYFADDHKNAQDPLGKTAHYDPDKMEIHILVTGRHLKDILRSISHELIHHVQNCKGELDDIQDTSAGYAQRDDQMRGLEHRAYTVGNIMNFRDFEDKFKSEKPIMNENNFKQKRLKALHSLLMEQSKYGAAIRGKKAASRGVGSDVASSLDRGRKRKTTAAATEGSGAISGAVGGAVTTVAGRSILTRVAAKLGYGAPSAVQAASAGGMKAWLMALGPAAIAKITFAAGEIAAFQALTAEVGFAATAGAAGAKGTVAIGGAAVAAGAILGTGIGWAINKGLYEQFGEEIGELATKAIANPGYAMKEMDVYCKGAGALCGKVVKCTGKSGGYEYETVGASALALGAGGKGEGGRSKTLFGRDWTQLAGQFHAKDGAIMAAMMSAIANDDIENERIKVSEDGKTAEVSKDANVNKYKDCFKANMMSSIMYNKIEKAGMGAAMAELQVILGMKKALPGGKGEGAGEGPEKEAWPDKPFQLSRVAATAELFYQALEGLGTDKPKLQMALATLKKMGPKFTRAVEDYFRTTPKYQDFDADGLRDALEDDLSGDDETRALVPFVLSDKALGAAGAGAGKGPQKCDGYPVAPGCTGKSVGTIMGIIVQGTKFGQATYNKNKEKITAMYNKDVYTPEVMKFFQGGLDEMDSAVAQQFANNKGVIKKGDAISNLLNKIATEKNIQEAKKHANLKNKRLFELNAKMMKRII